MTPSTDWPESWGAPPLFATARNPLLRSDGPLVQVIARNLGTPFIPWQAYTSEVANERRPDGSYEYQIVIVSVPRQTGKTTLIRAEGTHRCLVCGRDVFYTAQTGKDARARWLDLVKALRLNDALKDQVKVALRGGSEHVEFPGGAKFQVFAPTPESLHGYTPPTVMCDEVFSLTPAEGELLMGAIGPAQITIRDKQIWIVSTAGTAESTFLHDWITRGMEGMPRVAAFIWGATDDMNPYDLDDIRRFHPGVGFELNGKVLTAEDVLEQADRNTRAEYERAYANRRTLTVSHLISPEDWRACRATEALPDIPDGYAGVTLTYDVAADRTGSSLVASWRHAGRRITRLIAAAPGLAWLPDVVDQVRADGARPDALVAVGHGPVLEVTAELRRRDHHVEEVPEREFATACGAFLSSIEDRSFVHDSEPADALERSVTGLVSRAGVVDGVAFSRRHSVGDSSAGIATTIGLWRVAEEPAAAPFVYFQSA